METLTPFAQMPATPESVIAQVQRQLADDARHGEVVSSKVLDHMAERAVRELWESRVKTFVPILALRQARELLQDQVRGIPLEWPQANGVESPATAGPRHAEWSPRDLLHLDADVLRLDDHNVPHG